MTRRSLRCWLDLERASIRRPRSVRDGGARGCFNANSRCFWGVVKRRKKAKPQPAETIGSEQLKLIKHVGSQISTCREPWGLPNGVYQLRETIHWCNGKPRKLSSFHMPKAVANCASRLVAAISIYIYIFSIQLYMEFPFTA